MPNILSLFLDARRVVQQCAEREPFETGAFRRSTERISE